MINKFVEYFSIFNINNFCISLDASNNRSSRTLTWVATNTHRLQKIIKFSVGGGVRWMTTMNPWNKCAYKRTLAALAKFRSSACRK